MSASSNAPVIDGEDIANYGGVSSTDKWFTGGDGAARGQSFTTGGAAVRLKSISYQVTETAGAVPTKNYTLRVGKIAGTTFNQVYSETAIQTIPWTGGQFMTWTFDTPVLLEPYTTYGIDIGMTSSTTGWSTGIPYINITADEYAGGTSYTSGTNGIGTTSLSSAIASDRTFHLDIERPLGPVFALVTPSPADDSTDAFASREMVMTFSQTVTPGTGNLTLRNLSDGTDTVLPANDSRLTYDQNVVRINPTGLLTWNKNYAIRIDAGMFLGDGGAQNTAITDDTTWNFSTIAADPLLAAIAALKAHILNTTPLTLSQIAAHKTTIDNHRQRFAESTATISAVFDLISTYDAAKGPLFVGGFANNSTSFNRDNLTTTSKNSITPENYHWVIYTVMQYAMDLIYTAENLAKYEATLTNYKFGSHTAFPGPCSPPANPSNTHTVQINGSFPVTFGRQTQNWNWPARKPTGTYLAPGTIASVTVPAALVNAGYKIRVGAHSWDLSGRKPVNRLERATRLFSIDATTTKIASPYGGGIYIEVPQGASAGPVSVTITGAVRAPYFSAKSVHQTTAAEWGTERTHNAPWADFQSDKFMMQVPRRWIYNMTGAQATQLMVDWDKAMDAINSLMGFPLNRGKETMYCQVDIITRSSVFAPGYPAVNVTSNVNSEVSPAGYSGHYLVRGPGASPTASHVEFHEQGHAYGFPKFGGETESAVNLLQPAMLHRKFGYSLDVAQGGSLGKGSFHSLDNTAVAWMCCFSFSPNEIPMAELEKQYQHKGHAKFLDIVRLFGWSGLDTFWRSYMEDDANGVSYQNTNDEKMLRLCRTVGKDIRPLFHFWGVHPQNPSTLAAAIAAENIPTSPEIRDLLLHYKTLVIPNNAAYQAFMLNWWGKKPSVAGYWEETDHAMQWDETLDADNPAWVSVRPTITVGSKYVEGVAADIRARVDELVDLYFPTGMTPNTMSFATAPTVLNATTITMTATTVTAASPPVQYYFENTTNSTNSGWISTPTWQQTGLAPGSHSYRVKARDAFSTENNWSPESTVNLTSAGDTTPPSPSPMTFVAPPAAEDIQTITMTATTATDANSVQYDFENTTLGTNSGWQDSPAYTQTGLIPGTTYTYIVRARDAALNTTAASAPASATPPIPDLTPPSPDPMSFAVLPNALNSTSITMTATTATDPGGVEYFFECTAGGGPDSGWQNSTVFAPTGLTHSTSYTYTVRARDAAFNETSPSAPASATTPTPPKTIYSAGAKTWNTTAANWGLVTGGPYNTATWSSGDSAIFESTAGSITLGEAIHIKNLTINTPGYTITGSTLNFTAGTITVPNPPNNTPPGATIESNITGSPAVNLTPMDGDEPFSFKPAANGSMILGNVTGDGAGNGSNRIYFQGGAGSISSVGTVSGPKTFWSGSGKWTLTGVSNGYSHEISGGTLIISTGTLWNTNRSTILSGANTTLHYNNPAAIRDGAATFLGTDATQTNHDFIINGGNIDNTRGAAITTSTYNPDMVWGGSWNFIGSNGVNSNLFLGNGRVALNGTRTVTVANAAATLAIGGVIQHSSGSHGITKAGAGTLELRGANTYTGATAINAGTLILRGATHATNAITFGSGGTGVLGLNTGVSVAAAGAAVNLTNGSVQVLGTTGAPSYTLLTAASITGTPVLASPVTGYQLQLAAGNTQLLLVQAGTGSAYDTWKAVNASNGNPDDDFDSDGVPNAIEFVLGGNKDTRDLGKLPAVATNGGNMIFTFVRNRDSVDASVNVTLEVGTGLGSWPDVFTVGANTAGSSAGVAVSDNGDGTDIITLTVPRAIDTRKFARLKVVIIE
jgi:autotransporter-associated beta strand protein